MLALLVAIPLGAAEPLAHQGGVHVGTLSLGERDTDEDFHGERGCGDALTTHAYQLVVGPAASLADAILLEVPDARLGTLRVVATPGAPATVFATSPDTCARFALTGLAIEDRVGYVLKITPMRD